MRNPEVAILTVIAAVLVVGWAVNQADMFADTSADIWNDDDSINVTLNGFLPSGYSYSIYAGTDVSNSLYYWYDTSMPGMIYHSQQVQFYDALDSMLELRGYTKGQRIDTAALTELLQDTGNASGKAVYFCAGVLPKAVVEGDLLKNWILAGGTIHWSMGELGKSVTSESGIEEFDATYFFPEGTIAESTLSAGVTATYWSERMGVTLTNCSYGVNVQMLNDAGYNTVSLGLLNEKGFSSYAVTDYGSGRIYSLGQFNNNTYEAYYLMASADVIAYGIDTGTTEVLSGSGDKGYGTKQFTIEHAATAGEMLIVKIGMPFTNWAKVFTL